MARAARIRRQRRPATTRRALPARAAVGGALVALALAAGVAACGDDEDEQKAISKRDYIAQSGAICTSGGKQAGADYKRIVENGPRTAATAQRFLSESVVPIFRQGLAKRERLPAPDGDEREIKAMIDAGKQALAGFERAAASPSRSPALMRGQTPDPATDFDASSRRYGIAKCGGD